MSRKTAVVALALLLALTAAGCGRSRAALALLLSGVLTWALVVRRADGPA